ncbi:MAG: PAS domain S-box protein [Congregibacter sp.]
MTLLEKYRLSFDLSTVAQLLVSPDGDIQLTNRASEEMFEYPAGFLIGQPVECLLPETLRHSHPALRDAYRQLPTKRQMGQGRDLEGVTRTGRRVPLELGLEPVEEDGVRWVLVTAIDTTERQEGQALVRATLEAAASAIIMVSQDGSIISANKAANVLFGYAQEELVGQSIEILVPQDIRQRHSVFRASFFSASDQRSMGAGQSLYGCHKNGTEFRLEAALTPVEVSGRKLVLATIVDLSERLAAERALAGKRAAEAQSERLARLNDALNQFAYSVSHDLKAPMATIQGMLGLCLADLADGNTEELAANLQTLKDLSARSAEKVESVLKLARLGHESTEFEPVDLTQIARRLWREITLHETAPPRFEVNVALSAPFVSSTEAIQIILENLLSNAVKYRDHAKVDNWVQISARQDRGAVEITVADNGIGLANTEAEAIFDMFKRLTNRPGDGLGLAIVKRHVQALGGDVAVLSSLGVSTSFTIHLPQNP